MGRDEAWALVPVVARLRTTVVQMNAIEKIFRTIFCAIQSFANLSGHSLHDRHSLEKSVSVLVQQLAQFPLVKVKVKLG